MAWNLTVEDQIGILELDQPGTDVNVLTAENIDELKSILQILPTRNDIKALLITSAKKRIFIAGADIKEIRGISNEKDAFDKAEGGKAVLKFLEDLKIPTITVINGACLGGGYELALATDLRVASLSEDVKIGLPEVNLGILPGFGGSIRLPRLTGLLRGLPLILAGKMVSSKEALKNGMVDRLLPEVTIRQDSIAFARQVIEQGVECVRKKRKKDWMTSFLEDCFVGRLIVFHQARKDVLKKTKGFYPAPLEIIKLIEKTYGKQSPDVYRIESEHFARLGATEVSKNLIHLFFLNERYKKRKWTQSDIKPPRVRKCGVVGAGVMGGGIAQRVSYRNIPVRVKDINEKALAGALKEAHQIYRGAVKRRRLKPYEMEYKMGLISVGMSNAGLRNCDLIIEAVVEDLEIKKKVFAELDRVVPEKTILASNTSSLPVTQMAAATKFPHRVVGIHFFNPVHLMPLVEIIRAEKTSPETIEIAAQFSRDLGKTVIVVKDAPGFLVNRLLMPYMNEAAYLLEEGMSPDAIDRMTTKFGMPMGPIELVDQVGIDVAYKVSHVLESAFGKRMKGASILERAKLQGLLGKKSNRGFYLYDGKKKLRANPDVLAGRATRSISDDEAIQRMIYVMINEAARCLDEGVVDEAATVDIGMIFGAGFPAFRGGLLRYADSIGIPAIVSELRSLQNSVDPDRFAPCSYLLQLAENQGRFYSEKCQTQPSR